ncbi:MAG: transglycosylase domain-containing protein [Acidimicrobiales bacterium]|nr:transglycosylase domain-containing protein [Acidimicrobiales bacterium]
MRIITWLVKLLRLVLIVAVSGALVAVSVAVIAPQAYEIGHANVSVDEEIDLAALDEFAVRSYMYAADGSLLATLKGPENRLPVSLAFVPEPVIKSVLASEDADFYNHPGVNLRGMFRALIENVSSGSVEQGGSTITQQLVKNALLSKDQNIDRKTREIALALRLEKQLTKDQILEKYLNTVYFGSGAYGVQAAAETYWGLDVSQLGWAEGAMLAALIAKPVEYDPTLHPDRARIARKAVLDRLVDTGVLTKEQAEGFDRAPLPRFRCGEVNSPATSCHGRQPPPPEDYFAEEVRKELLRDPKYNLGNTDQERYNTLYGGGLRIYTTLLPQAQAAAYAARDEIAPKSREGLTAAIVAIENGTGAVRVMVGGPGFENFEYNIATAVPGRQTGSSFKTFVLLTALEQGNVPSDYVQGGGTFQLPCQNDRRKTHTVNGPGGTLTSITAASSNGAYVRLGQIVGLDNVIELTRKLGITSNFDPCILTTPLGVTETSPLQMAGAYSAIPNGGIYQPPYMVERIEDRTGKVIYQHEPNGTRAFSEQTACLATQILEENVRSGTGTRARLPHQRAAGKTGTTEVNADVWFVGFTPYLTTAVWMGIPTGQVALPYIDGVRNFGGFFPARMWSAFNAAYHENLETKDFPRCRPTRPGRQVTGPNVNSKNLPPPTDTRVPGDAPSTTGSSAPRTTATNTPTTAGPSSTSTPPTTAEPPTTSPPPTTPPAGGGRNVETFGDDWGEP